METSSIKSYSSCSKSGSVYSSSSISSFIDDTPKKKKKVDRMIYSIDKAQYDWSQKKIKKKTSIKQVKINPLPEQKFSEYLSDNMSEDSHSFKEFYGKSILKRKIEIQNKRKISDKPFKKTKFFKWTDNFYTNLLDWNSDNFIFAANDTELYQYGLANLEQKKPKVHPWLNIKGARINSIKCNEIQRQIAIAYDYGSLRIYDYYRQRTLNLQLIHISRITALDWIDRSILTGSKDRMIRMCDDRTYKQSVFFKQIHNQEVLAVKRFGNYVASGGNDNLVAIYDIRKSDKLMTEYEHLAAVKSLAWIESQKMLLSGGGTSDKMIKFWSIKQNQVVKQIETGSQICNFVVSKNTKQFISCQGFSQNQIVLWDLEGNRLETIHGTHSARVLYCALSPSGQYLATGAGDKNLLIWKIFPPQQRKNRLLQSIELR